MTEEGSRGWSGEGICFSCTGIGLVRNGIFGQGREGRTGRELGGEPRCFLPIVIVLIPPLREDLKILINLRVFSTAC